MEYTQPMFLPRIEPLWQLITNICFLWVVIGDCYKENYILHYPLLPLFLLSGNENKSASRHILPPLKYLDVAHPIGGVMVRVFSSSVVDREFEPRSGQTKDYQIGICCFSAKHVALSGTSKDWLARNQNNVFKWSDMSTCWLLFQWASSLKIQFSGLHHQSSHWKLTCSRHDSWKIAELNNIHSFIHSFIHFSEYLFSMTGHWWLLQGKLFLHSPLLPLFTLWQWRKKICQ